MDKQTVVALLRKFNQWRKGEISYWDGDVTGPNPREISEAIDVACRMIEQEPAAQPVASALSRFNAHMEETDNASPLERLRFFLSLALSPQDWIDVEPFLDALGERSVAVPDDFLPSWANYRQGKEDGKAEATCILHERAEAAIRTLERMRFEWTGLPGSEHMDWYEEAVTREMFPGTYDALEKLSANKRSDSHE